MPRQFSVTPAIVFGVLLALTAAAVLLEASSRARRRRVLRNLAGQWRMTYSPDDRLRLTARVASCFPVPGAADVLVRDVIYGREDRQYRYVFTAEYTLGVIRSKRRICRAGTFCEPRGGECPSESNVPSGTLHLADEDLPLLEQYRRLAPVPKPPG